MDITTAESLGDKLAALDLTDDEATLLGSILSAGTEAEVQGFFYDEVEIHLVPVVRQRAGKGWSWGMTNTGSVAAREGAKSADLSGLDLGSGR